MASSVADETNASITSEPEDLTSSPHSLSRAVHARRKEYVRPHRIRVKVGTWNVGGFPGTDKDLDSWFIAGKGLDHQNLATLDLTQNPAIERQDTIDTHGNADSGGIRLVGGDAIGLYVLGLQEIVDLNMAVQVSSRLYTDTGPTEKWKAAMEAAVPKGYQRIACEQMMGLLLLVYASPEVAPSISNVSTVSTGTGLMGYMGNKGAVTTRIVLGETTRMVFVNCHLASGTDPGNLDRRIWDSGHIANRTTFDPVSYAGVTDEEPEKIGDADFAFWFGDLNFRLDDLPGDDIRRLLTLHSRGEYGPSRKSSTPSLDGEGIIVLRSSESCDEQVMSDTSTTHSYEQSDDDTDNTSLPDPDDFPLDPHDDPASLQATLDSLLPHDQLLRVMRVRKAFHDGWREGAVTFLPTYKYDVGAVSLFDSSDKRRAPSWCDRILYRTRKDKENYDQKIADEEEARKKDEEMKARGIDLAADDDEVLFDYDPDHDGEGQTRESVGLDYDAYEIDDDEEGEAGEMVITKDGFRDKINLDIYTSHQRITSSDHKPVISVFTLDYDAVVPELKAQVHAEVAWELDRAENEGRPVVTVVLDGQSAWQPNSNVGHEVTDDGVDFGEVAFLKKSSASLTLANTGRVPATFSFIDNPASGDDDVPSSPSPQWLYTRFIRPDAIADDREDLTLESEVTLEPGDTVNAVLEVLVDDVTLARSLNDGQAALEDVLVFRVRDGRDYFIPTRATWLPTCIGRSIEELIRVPSGGIRPFARTLAEEKGRAGSISYELEVHSAAPKELFKLIEAVETPIERVLADDQMLEECKIPRQAPGWPFDESSWVLTDKNIRRNQSAAIIEALDTDQPIGAAFAPETPAMHRLELVAEVLLLFLGGLTDGVITAPLWARIEGATLPTAGIGAVARPAGKAEAVAEEDDKTAVLDLLAAAPNHNIAFVFLATTLARVVGELAPVSRADAAAVRQSGLERRSLSFRRSQGPVRAIAAMERRAARERRVAGLFGPVVCRAQAPARDKEKRALLERQKGVVELFLKRAREDG